MNFRCPRHKARMLVNAATCASRKERKERGCATCNYPRQVEVDLRALQGLHVGFDSTARGARKARPFYILGLPIKGGVAHLSRRLAMELRDRLDLLLAAHK